MSEHTGSTYHDIAKKYAEQVDHRPYNAYYERPATLSLLPPLEGLRVLDIGSGSGWYGEYYLNHGASVTSFDFNADFVQYTRARIGSRAEVFQADLSQPLAFAESASFDLAVAPLVLHYLYDWVAPLKEIHRVLKPRGMLVFSTHHPTMDWQLFEKEDYFAIERIDDDWKDIGKVSYYRRPLTAMSAALYAAGFYIDYLLEPQATEEFRQAVPERYDRMMKNPGFLVIRAVKKG